MLMPDYDELTALKKETRGQEWNSKRKVGSTHLGGHTSLFKGRGLDFSEFREYSPGDDIRAIDWRVTARKGRPHTKIFTEERERSVYIILDLNRYMQFGTRNTFKSVQSARAAALIAWTSHQLKDKTGAILFGSIPGRIQFLPAKGSRKSIWRMLKLICTESPNHSDVKIEEALERARKRIHTGSSVFVISDFFLLSPEFKNSLGALSRKCEVTLVQVNDPADLNIPNSDRIQFLDEDGQSVEIDTSDELGAKRYRELWANSDRTLIETARQLRAKLFKISTESNVTQELSRSLNSALSRKVKI
jgi:uncharacterized protein (DUF58 family)